MRFEPGDIKTVTLCAIAGGRIITGGNRLATGIVDLSRTGDIVRDLVRKGFGHIPEPGALEVTEDTDIGRDAYVAMFGPTVGDRVRLGDTALWVEVERDEVGLTELSVVGIFLNIMTMQTVYGDEVKFGGGQLPLRFVLWLAVIEYFAVPGKTVREGMGQATNRPASETLDLVITNALIIDWSGIYKVGFPACVC